MLIGAPRRGTSEIVYAEDHLDELARLADTAGAAIAGRIIQRIHAPTSNYYLGHGKVEQLKRLAKERDATLAVFDEELSPVQGKNLERELDLRVMDRSELILDIFATRARSKEAKLEVELAQLEYLLPRLARMWVHLSRIRGGIGLRGPGETQLETDRRMIRRKISRLKAKLAKVERHREVVRSGRRPIPTAALVGYTNAGKSSLLRALSGANTFVEDRLFATLDTLTREMFIRKLPHHLVASFRATLTEAAQADVLCHVIDAAHPRWDEQADVVDEVLGGLSLDSQPLLHVFNKMDRVAEPEALETRVTARYEHAVLVSAIKREVGPLVDKLRVLANGIPEEPKRAQPRVG